MGSGWMRVQLHLRALMASSTASQSTKPAEAAQRIGNTRGRVEVEWHGHNDHRATWLRHRHRTFNVPGRQSHFRYLPAGLVGGDYCDLFELEKGLFFLIGDVSGKGLGASVLTSHLHATFRGLADAGLEIQPMVEAANRVFCESTLAEHFATLIVGCAAHDGSVEFVNAGHMPLLHICTDAVRAESATGFPLGMFPDARFPSRHIFLDPGDSLLMYTDGVTEARNAADEEYGVDRLKLIAARHCTSGTYLLDEYLEDMRDL
jgi:phosphoserine phosphatase RsbU/P